MIFVVTIELIVIALLCMRSFNFGKRLDRLERFSSEIINERMATDQTDIFVDQVDPVDFVEEVPNKDEL